MAQKIISAELAYEYAKKNYPSFPNDWFISKHFTWNEVFISEEKEDGCPSLGIFKNAVKSSTEFEKERELIGLPFVIHCWYRSASHILRMIRQGYNPAVHSSHNYAMAIDYHVVGMTFSAARVKLLQAIKDGKLKLRIELNTPDRVHSDTGNPYTKDFNWGGFNP